MGVRNRAAGRPPLSVGELITYAANGDVERITDRFDSPRPVVGIVVSDVAGQVTFTDLLPEPVARRVAVGGFAPAGRPAVVGGRAGFTNAARLGGGFAPHFIVGIWANNGTGGDDVLMHPVPHWCTGGDVE
jgi:hypothetical protein